jgi:cobalt-zinc-cadmium resistance protein CzcA
MKTFLLGELLMPSLGSQLRIIFCLAILVSAIRIQAQERPLDKAVVRGSQDRLRPVLMTACIAVFSLIPMLYATGLGSEVQRPLATVVVGGLLTSTFLTLVVLPSLYGLFEPKKQLGIESSLI